MSLPGFSLVDHICTLTSQTVSSWCLTPWGNANEMDHIGEHVAGPKTVYVMCCHKTCWVCLVWNKKTWHLVELNHTANQAAMETVCVCVCAERIPSEGTLLGPDLVSSWKRQGPPPLWQTSAFALRPVEISNLCLTRRKGQAHPWFPSGVEPDHFLPAPLDPLKTSDPRYHQADTPHPQWG